MSVTPYVVGQWVRGESFYGRSELIHDILHGNRNCLWLLGTRRVGKTSTLKELERLTSHSRELGYFPLYWDFQGAEKPEDLHESLSDSLLDAMDRLEELDIPLERVESDDLFESISRLRRELRTRELALLLLGDEVEELITINEREPRFLRRLRRALQSAENIRTVLASKIKLWELASEDTSTSPFLHGFTPPHYVFGLDDDAARSLITQSNLPEDSRPELDERTIETIRERCNNHPYLLQLVCERYLELGELEAAVEEIAADQMVRHFFAVDFEMLSETERNIIRIVSARRESTTDSISNILAVDSSALSGDLSRLEHLGFIHRASLGGYALANFFFKRWFSELPSVQRAHRPGSNVPEATVQEATLAEASSAEAPRRIDTRYELLDKLGQGATGEVYKAHDTLLRSDVAIKLLRHEYCTDEDAVVRLRREVLLSRDLTHPNVLKTYHLGDDNGQMYVTMQFVDGPDLSEVIAKEAPLAVDKAVVLATKLAAALAAAHRAGVVHRDIKPSNILIDEHGEPRITDFGLARLVDGPEITRHGRFVGTPVYASPEQIQGHNLDERTDLYSLGIVIFEMVTGRRPFTSDSIKGIERQHLEVEPPSPKELRPGTPEVLSDIILRCLAKGPAERFQTAEELGGALASLELERIG